MNEWLVGSFPIPSWIVENADWSILRDGDKYFFEPKAEDGNGASEVWLLAKGEVVRLVDGAWYFGEQKIVT